VKLGYGHVSVTGDLYGSDNSVRYGLGVIWRIDPHSGLILQYMYQKASIPNVLGNGDFKNNNLTVGYNWFFNY
jgi:outer membrane autotransporter protein